MIRHARALGAALLGALGLTPPTHAAGLPAVDWPQSRCDASLSGRSPEPAVVSPGLLWQTPVGPALAGEPVALGCLVYVTDSSGAISGLNSHDGSILWPSPLAYTRAQPVASALATDDAGTLYAGRPGDTALVDLAKALYTIRTGVEAYTVDNGFRPGGPDLAPSLVPIFVAAMPDNPIAGGKMIGSATPSPGDYNYERAMTGSGYDLASWWTDGMYSAAVTHCGEPAAWPIGPVQGGVASAHDAGSGATLWEDLGAYPGRDVVPAVAGDGVVWAATEASTRETRFLVAGRVRKTGFDGMPVWERRLWAPPRGGVARDPVSGALFFARAPAKVASYLDSMLRGLGISVEIYQVDFGIYPPGGELRPSIVPTFLACMANHPWERRSIQHTSVPFIADYEYMTTPARDSYTITLWDEDGTPAGVYSNGTMVSPPVDRPPQVWSLAADGSVLWHVAVGGLTDDVSPLARRSDGSLVLGTKSGDVVALSGGNGQEIWRTPVGAPVLRAPALLPDDGVVVVNENGEVIALAPGGGERWRYPTGLFPTGAPTTTADGYVYHAGGDGLLRILDPGGAPLLPIDLGGPARAGLSTAVIQAGGLLFVGRTDGVMIGLGAPATVPLPPDLGNTLRLVRELDDVVADWSGAPAACSYRLRRSSDPASPPDAPVAAEVPPGPPRDPGAVSTPAGLEFYRLYGVDCCGGQGP